VSREAAIGARRASSALRAGMRRRTSQALAGSVILFGALALAGIGYGSLGGAAERLVTVFFINLVIVVGLQTFTGNSGVLSFGHVSFAAIAAYTTAILSSAGLVKHVSIPDAPFGLTNVSLPVWASALIAIALTALIALVVGIPIARLSGIGAAIVTLALLIVVHSMLVNWVDLTNGAEAFYGIPAVTTRTWAMLAALLAIVAARFFKETSLGLRLQASREDELAAASMGVDVGRSRLAAWVVSAAMAGAGGVLLAHFLGAISPAGLYFELTFVTLAMLVLGGMPSVTGAAVGAVVITVGSEITRYISDGPRIAGAQLPTMFGLSQLFLGLVIVAVMIVRPSGVVGDREAEDIGTALLRRIRRSRGSPAEGRPSRWPAVAAPAAATGEATAPLRVGTGRALVVHDVTKSFQGLVAVRDVSLEVGPGEIVGLIGPNGAGKTTLLNVVSGVLEPSAGAVTLGGAPLRGRTVGAARSGIARTFQNIRLFGELTVRQNVQVSESVAARHRTGAGRMPTDRLLAEFGLEAVADRKAGTLPFGQQRRVEAARAVALAPDVLLLDEPAAGMNEVESMQLLREIRRIRDLLGCGVLVVDHDLHFILNVCDRIYVLDGGRLISAGTPSEVQRDPVVMVAYLGTAPEDQPEMDRG
jgi:branched-chain amino acid transport system ATP-binding protein/branched-chain amino acid transport system permease protein